MLEVSISGSVIVLSLLVSLVFAILKLTGIWDTQWAVTLLPAAFPYFSVLLLLFAKTIYRAIWDR